MQNFSEPRTQRSGVSGCPMHPLTPLRCVRGSDSVGRLTTSLLGGACILAASLYALPHRPRRANG